MRKLEARGDGKYVTAKKPFAPLGAFNRATVEGVLRFAYDMSFGARGEHRTYRSGGTHVRKNGEIFTDAFQGKLAEFGIYNLLCKTHDISAPELGVWGRGEWDDGDFIINGKKASVKSTKRYGQLLLLETQDWTKQGAYIPNLDKDGGLYDLFVLVRTDPVCADLLKSLNFYYADEAPYGRLEKLLTGVTWRYDVPGFVYREELIEAIAQGNIIYKGEMLNGNMKMDAENYYIQAGDMHPVSGI